MEIRASLVVPETGVQDTNRLAIGGAKISTAQTLMLPDDLQQALGRRAQRTPYGRRSAPRPKPR